MSNVAGLIPNNTLIGVIDNKDWIDESKCINSEYIKELNSDNLYEISFPVSEYHDNKELQKITFLVNVIDLEFVPFGDNLRTVDTKSSIVRKNVETLMNNKGDYQFKNGKGIKKDTLIEGEFSKNLFK